MQASESITRRSASNLALAFILLPREKRRAMAALYAFCREVDDVADEESVPAQTRRERLRSWRDDIRAACNGGRPQFPVNRELQPVTARYRLPLALFEELLDGVEMDLETRRYADYETLELYCYRVASVVGLLSIEIFGYRNPACRDYAIHLGQALQLTNILRDVGNDAARGRIYLPRTELERYDVREDELLKGVDSERFRALAASVAARAASHYQRAHDLLPAEDRRSMISAELMGSVYWRLLRKLEQRGFPVLDPEPMRLNKAQKLGLILRTWLRFQLGSEQPNYGTAKMPLKPREAEKKEGDSSNPGS
jgi:15-cis-phytoene synthase